MYCRVLSALHDTIFEFDDNGVLNLPYAVDSIQLLSELCPERVSSFILQPTPHIYTFNIQPWIVEVFFKGDTFHFEEDHFEGQFMLLPDNKTYRFVKQTE
jgi:hypothetical protein